jgi:YihY family inner membrane protein
MSTATRVPETSRIPGAELDGSDARTALRRFGHRRLAVESFRRFRYGDGFSHSRAVGFQLVLALIPLTIAMAGLSSAARAEGLGLVIRDTLLSLTPGSSDQVIRDTIDQGLSQAKAGLLALWLGLATALVALTTAMGQVERGANRIYGIQRDRPARQKYTRALGLALVAGIPLVLGFLALVAGEQVIAAVANQYELSAGVAQVARALRWPIGLGLALVAITATFRWAPRRRQPAPSWMAVGSAVALVLWVLLTGLLSAFVRTSGSFGAVYGPLTAVMALMLWAFMTGIALFLGLSFAAQLEAVRAGIPTGAGEDPEADPRATRIATTRHASIRRSPSHAGRLGP